MSTKLLQHLTYEGETEELGLFSLSWEILKTCLDEDLALKLPLFSSGRLFPSNLQLTSEMLEKLLKSSLMKKLIKK